MVNSVENRFPCGSGSGHGRDSVGIEANHIFDACRDRDCFENTRVFLTPIGEGIIERTGTVRTKEATIVSSNITIDPVQFNRGFYSVTIRFFIHLVFEGCVGLGKGQEFGGLAVVEKKVILYGGESNVSVFRSVADGSNFCGIPQPSIGVRNVPEAVVEVIDPIVLSTEVVERSVCQPCQCSCCCACDIPESVVDEIGGNIVDSDNIERYLLVSLGIFSIVRIVRPAQYLVSATEYSIPDKECVMPDEENPCRLFNSMAFPVNEFDPPDYSSEFTHGHEKHCGCGCGADRTDK